MIPFVGVIIVHYNSKKDTLDCLESLRASTYSNVEILVVDNASTDGLIDMLRKDWPEVTAIYSPENRGFTGGNNIGIEYFVKKRADYILLLNNDAVVEPETIARLVDAAQQAGGDGVFGAIVLGKEDPNTVVSAGGRMIDGWRLDHYHHIPRPVDLRPVPVDFVSGAALMGSLGAVEKIGLLDDRFFLYFEDTDYCYRAKQAGLPVMLAPSAVVYHPDTALRDDVSTRAVYYTVRNTLLFGKKNALSPRARAAMLFDFVRMWASWTIKPRWRYKKMQKKALEHALVDYFAGRFGRPERIE